MEVPFGHKLKLFVEVVRSFVRLEYADSFRRRLQDGKIGLQFNEDQCDVIYWLTLQCLFSPFMPQLRLPFFRIPRTWVDATEQVNYIGHVDPLKKFDPKRLLPQMLREQIGTKSEFGGNVERSKSARKLCWALINRLFIEDQSTFPPFVFSGNELDDLRAAAEMIGKENLLEDILMTNVACISGRIGVPVKFYERLYADCTQAKNDLMTSIAFHLIKEGINVLTVNESGFTILFPQTSDSPEGDAITSLVIQSVRRSLKGAFPSGFLSEELLEQLLPVLID